MKTRMAMLAVAAATLGFSGMAGAQSVLNMRTFDETYAREDFDARPADIPALACEVGFTTPTMARPGVACGVAYEKAVAEKRFEDAMRHAAKGCTRDRSIESCRNAGGLPLWMGNQDIAVPASFRGELRRVADAVCFSRMRLKTMNGKDVTARECSNLARRFTMAKDPEYVVAMRPEARRFFESIHDPAIAASLHLAACQRLGAAASCNQAIGLRSEVERLARANGVRPGQ